MFALKNDTGLVLYDGLSVIGGAEKVTLELLEMFPESKLVTGYVNRGLFSRLDVERVVPIAQSTEFDGAVLRSLRLMWAFGKFGRKDKQYEWALFSGIFAPSAAVNGIARRNVMYCHAIPRLCFDLREYYLEQFPLLLRPGVSLFMWLIERRFDKALKKMDLVLCNSVNVQRDLFRFFGCRARVVHPPIRVEDFRWIRGGDEYVSVGRLEPLKRVGPIIEAFAAMPERRLIVVSGGSEERELRRLARGLRNIVFTGWLSDAELVRCIGSARAVIYLPVNEDFGMAPVEAMAAGKPVIGVAEGGLLETVIDGETGVLISGEVSSSAISAAVERLEAINPLAMRQRCEQRAREFSRARFFASIQHALGTLT